MQADGMCEVHHQPGGGPGISCWVFILQDKDLVLVVLTNMTAAPSGGKQINTIVEVFLAARDKVDLP